MPSDSENHSDVISHDHHKGNINIVKEKVKKHLDIHFKTIIEDNVHNFIAVVKDNMMDSPCPVKLLKIRSGHHGVEDEVKIMCYIRKSTNVPVPEVFNHGSLNNIFSYILMEYFEDAVSLENYTGTFNERKIFGDWVKVR
jgi:hypothetical protein